MSDAVGAYYDEAVRKRDEQVASGAIIRCPICNNDIYAIAAAKEGVCNHCVIDLRIHRRLHEYEDRLKREEVE